MMVVRAVVRNSYGARLFSSTDRHASVNAPKRTEQNLIVHSGKCEAKVTNNKRRRSRYRTGGANYRQT